MAANEQPFDVEAIVRVVGDVHPSAIVCARAGRPTLICDGFEGLLLTEDADGWLWRKDAEDQPLQDLEELTGLLREMAKAYDLEPQFRRTQAEQFIDALRVRWIREAEAAPPPRLWGLCAPGRPRKAISLPRVVLYDAPRPITCEQIAAEVQRLHSAAHVCFDKSWPTLVDDGISWLMFFDWWDGWRWSLDGEDQGEVLDYLGLQVVLAEVAAVYAAVDEGRRQRAVEHVRELSRLPLFERYRWTKDRARRRAETGRAS